MKRYFNWFELTLIGIVSLISLYFLGIGWTIGDPILLILDIVAAICGILSVVLCAKGKKSGFIFGLVNVIFYAIISFNNLYFGEVMLNTFFYIPMNIISYFIWSKHNNIETQEVKTRSLTVKQIIISGLIILVITFIYHLFLVSLGGAMTYLDGLTTILSIFATLLMAARYAEQWLYWIIIDAITIVLWIVAGSPVMIVMWGAYLINAIYGYLCWLLKSGKKIPFLKNEKIIDFLLNS